MPLIPTFSPQIFNRTISFDDSITSMENTNSLLFPLPSAPTMGLLYLWLAALTRQQLGGEGVFNGKTTQHTTSLKLITRKSSFSYSCTKQWLPLEGRTALCSLYKPTKKFSLINAGNSPLKRESEHKQNRALTQFTTSTTLSLGRNSCIILRQSRSVLFLLPLLKVGMAAESRKTFGYI